MHECGSSFLLANLPSQACLVRKEPMRHPVVRQPFGQLCKAQLLEFTPQTRFHVGRKRAELFVLHSSYSSFVYSSSHIDQSLVSPSEASTGYSHKPYTSNLRSDSLECTHFIARSHSLVTRLGVHNSLDQCWKAQELSSSPSIHLSILRCLAYPASLRPSRDTTLIPL